MTGRRFPGLHSLRRQLILIVLVFMSVVLVSLGFFMGNFIRGNIRRQREYLKAANETIAVSLNSMGENIQSLASYMASFEAFQNLYFPEGRQPFNSADMVSSAFHSVRFLIGYYPVFRDVIVVGLNRFPFSYYSGSGYDFMDLIDPEYHFEDPGFAESRFFYFEGKDYFIYATPVNALYSSAGNTSKIATCVFICDTSYIEDILNIDIPGEDIRFSVYAGSGNLVAQRGTGVSKGEEKIKIESRINSMSLRVTASGTGGFFAGEDQNVRFIRNFFIFSFALVALITLTIIFLLQRQVARPISNLIKSMASQDHGPLRTRLAKSGIDELDQIAESVNALLDEIEVYLGEKMTAQEKLYEMELRKNEAEIYALQSQINPHFLNNTLQCIRGIAITRGVEEIAAISLAMSELFRYSMNYEEQVLVREEIEMARHYVMINNIRFRNRFGFVFDIAPDVLDCTICRMTLQPLVENAVNHGVSQRESGGVVEIKGRRRDGLLLFEVTDNGPGFDKAKLAEIERNLSQSFAESRELHKGKSFGLYNIARRLELHYGKPYGLEIKLLDDGRTTVRLKFPVSG